MIKIVRDLSPYHNNNVAKAMEQLQNNGYEILSVKRISRDYFFWGENVTHIHYRKDK